jgi:hypothetical protein
MCPAAVENAGDEAVRDVKVSVERSPADRRSRRNSRSTGCPAIRGGQGVAILPKESVGQPPRATVKGYAIP